jgi:hypothetical protein
MFFHIVLVYERLTDLFMMSNLVGDLVDFSMSRLASSLSFIGFHPVWPGSNQIRPLSLSRVLFFVHIWCHWEAVPEVTGLLWAHVGLHAASESRRMKPTFSMLSCRLCVQCWIVFVSVCFDIRYLHWTLIFISFICSVELYLSLSVLTSG